MWQVLILNLLIQAVVICNKLSLINRCISAICLALINLEIGKRTILCPSNTGYMCNIGIVYLIPLPLRIRT
jgi:hypothetical protein